MQWSIGVAIFALTAVAASPGLSASFLNTVNQLGLTNDDVRIAGDEAAKLYEAGTIEVGADSIWQNLDSGAYGKVEILAFDGRCVTIEHVFRSGKTKQAHRVNARRCKGEDGVWRIAAE
jgi:hypothetical protein